MSIEAQQKAGAGYGAVKGLTRSGAEDLNPSVPPGAGHPPDIKAAIDRARRETNRIATGARLVSGVTRLVEHWGFRKVAGRTIVISMRLEKIRRALLHAGSPLANNYPAIRSLSECRGRWEDTVTDALEHGWKWTSMQLVGEVHPKLARCRSCAGRVVWLDCKGGGRMIADADTVRPTDTEYDPPRNRAHWVTCPNAKKRRQDGKESEDGT